MTGDLSPDTTGDYLPHIIYNGKMSYRRKDGAWFIWWDGVRNWIINDELGAVRPAEWLRREDLIEGDYEPNGEATGIATVTEI